MNITGQITAALDIKSGVSKSTGKEWRSQEYVIQTVEQYPKGLVFTVFGDDIDKFRLMVGQIYTIDFDTKAREYNGKWYNDVRAWQATPHASQAASPQAASPQAASPQAAPVSGDLPF